MKIVFMLLAVSVVLALGHPSSDRLDESNSLTGEERADRNKKQRQRPYYPYYQTPRTYTVPNVTVQLNVSPYQSYQFDASGTAMAPLNPGQSTVLSASYASPNKLQMPQMPVMFPLPNINMSALVPGLVNAFSSAFSLKRPSGPSY